MNLLINKISNNGDSISLKKRITINVEFDSIKETFKINYKPLDLEVEQKSVAILMDQFGKRFFAIYKKPSEKYKQHLKEIVL
jgi:hypothetical protein